jgi:hypothetical protein
LIKYNRNIIIYFNSDTEEKIKEERRTGEEAGGDRVGEEWRGDEKMECDEEKKREVKRGGPIISLV